MGDPHISIVECRPAKVAQFGFPNLAKAWGYFEHYALPRHLLNEDGLFDCHELERAVPGEVKRPTRLYDPLFTPLSSMGNFGIGVACYFITLRALALLLFVAGLLNLQNMSYFSSQAYSDGQIGVSRLFKGSAICTRVSHVFCEDCKFGPDFSEGRLIQAEGGMLALKNLCNGATLQVGLVNFMTLLFMLAGLLLLCAYLQKREIECDEGETTCQDFSVRILNPPPNAFDLEEWRKFSRMLSVPTLHW